MPDQPAIPQMSEAIQPADVYFNLHRGVWSCKSRKTGRVSHHARVVVSFMPGSMVVRESGRQRVLKERRKNVHAFARLISGAVSEDVDAWRDYAESLPGIVPVSYNPYRAGHFYRKDTQEPIHDIAGIVMLAPVGQPPLVLALPL